jgi:RNA polymerase sigma factor (TIGR02999 family)
MVDYEQGAAENLLPMIYDSLVHLARNRMVRYGTREYLNPAELVHEAYLRVVRGNRTRFEGRRHLFFVISRAMKDLLIEDIRRNLTGKRGSGFSRVELETTAIAVESRPGEYLDLKVALRRLARNNSGCAQVVVLSYFVGLTQSEIAGRLQLSLATVERRWKYARTWLRRELTNGNVRRFGDKTRLH